MTTLIPKFDFKNGGATPTGAINRTIREKLAEVISVTDFGADPTGVADSTTAVNNAIAYATAGYDTYAAGKAIYFPAGSYKIGALAPITVPLFFDFNNAYVYPNTTAIMFELAYSTTFDALKTVFQDLNIIGGAANASNLFKITTGNNTVFNNVNFRGVQVTNALIWNYAAYGLTVNNCGIRGCVAPTAFYFSKSLIDDSKYSNAVELNHIMISGHTGIGVYNEGGDILIGGKSIFEACSNGAIKTINNTNSFIVTDCYFEANYQYDISITEQLYGGNYTVRSCFFGGAANVSTPNRVYIDTSTMISGAVNVTVQDCEMSFGGVTGPVGTSPQYVGINNQMQAVVTGWTKNGQYNYELSTISAPTIKSTIINDYGINGTSVGLTYTNLYSDTAWTGATGSTPPNTWSIITTGTFTIVNAGSAPYDVALKIACNGTNANPSIYRTYTTVVGKKYRFSFAMLGSTPQSSVYLGTAIGGANYVNQPSTSGQLKSYMYEFVASSTSTYVTLIVATSVSGEYGIFDQVLFDELGAQVVPTI